MLFAHCAPDAIEPAAAHSTLTQQHHSSHEEVTIRERPKGARYDLARCVGKECRVALYDLAPKRT
eukprot:scaffold3818_cov18-Tisochrysis_lutea.AAC.1